MPWLSPPSTSPEGSPRNRYTAPFDHRTNDDDGAAPSPPPPPRAAALGGRATAPSITYIPQLIDGAYGTMPHAQRAVQQRLASDLSSAARLLPALVHAAVAARVDLAELAPHVALVLLETSMLVSAVPLWLCLPGAVFVAWLALCGALVGAASRSLNGGRDAAPGRLLRCAPAAAADGGRVELDAEEEQWFYVGGMGLSARSLTQKTLPALAHLFHRPIESVHAPTYGLPLDFLLLLLQRCLSAGFPSTAHARTLYVQIRTAVLDPNRTRVVILAHNAGAVTVSHMLHQLYADISADKMGKLEIYTFGAAAADFSIPLSGIATTTTKSKQHKKHAANGSSALPFQYPPEQQQQKQQAPAPALAAAHRGPYVEHFAFANDPFAKMGVLRSVHEDLEGRFCGSVFELDCPGAAHHGSPRRRANETRAPARCLVSLHDYLACLFPEHTRPRTSSRASSLSSTPVAFSAASSSASSSRTSSRSRRRNHHHHDHHHHHHRQKQSNTPGSLSILDTPMRIDRDLAEKREFAALAQHSASVRSKGGKKRLSWTGLGATAGAPANGNMDGVVGLEMARKGCRDCQGHRARDVSRLARYTGHLPQPPEQELGAGPGDDGQQPDGCEDEAWGYDGQEERLYVDDMVQLTTMVGDASSSFAVQRMQ